jgi:hypothetical protein
MALYCVCCGDDIHERNTKRLLKIEASQHVVVLWSEFFKDELRKTGRSKDVGKLVAAAGRQSL